MKFLKRSALFVLFLFSFSQLSFGRVALPKEANGSKLNSPNKNPSCFILLSTLFQNGGSAAARVKRNLLDTTALTTGEDVSTNRSASARNALVALGKESDVLPLLRQGAKDDLRDRSKQILDALQRATSLNKIDQTTQVYDFIVIGAGVQEGIFQNALVNSSSKLKGITIERSNEVASNFGMSPYTFSINSSNRQDLVGVQAIPGVGNINRLPGGAIQVPDLYAQKYPPAAAVADATLLNRLNSPNDILFETEVTSVRDRMLTKNSESWPARYRVLIYSKRKEAEFVLYTNNIVDSTGLGVERVLTVESNAGNALILRQKSMQEEIRFETPVQELPDIYSFDDFRRMTSVSGTPYRQFTDQDVLVIGGGDSGKVTNEFLFREAPSEAYKTDKAQLGNVKKVVWAGVPQQTCEEYILSNRVRYANLAAAYRNGTLEPTPNRVIDVAQLANGKYEVTFQGDNPGTVIRGQFDKIIYAIGYEKRNGQFYSSILPAVARKNEFVGASPVRTQLPRPIINITIFETDKDSYNFILGNLADSFMVLFSERNFKNLTFEVDLERNQLKVFNPNEPEAKKVALRASEALELNLNNSYELFQATILAQLLKDLGATVEFDGSATGLARTIGSLNENPLFDISRDDYFRKIVKSLQRVAIFGSKADLYPNAGIVVDKGELSLRLLFPNINFETVGNSLPFNETFRVNNTTVPFVRFAQSRPGKVELNPKYNVIGYFYKAENLYKGFDVLFRSPNFKEVEAEVNAVQNAIIIRNSDSGVDPKTFTTLRSAYTLDLSNSYDLLEAKVLADFLSQRADITNIFDGTAISLKEMIDLAKGSDIENLARTEFDIEVEKIFKRLFKYSETLGADSFFDKRFSIEDAESELLVKFKGYAFYNGNEIKTAELDVNDIQAGGFTEDIIRPLNNGRDGVVALRLAPTIIQPGEPPMEQNIFFLGPGANLVRDGENELLAGVSQNQVSIFINGERSYIFGQVFNSELRSPDVFKASPLKEMQKTKITQANGSYELNFNPNNLPPLEPNMTSGLEDYFLTRVLKRIVDRIDFSKVDDPAIKTQTLRIEILNSGFSSGSEQEQYAIRFAPYSEGMDEIFQDESLQMAITQLIGSSVSKNRIMIGADISNRAPLEIKDFYMDVLRD